MRRKLNTFQTMNSDAEVHLSANNYNEIGQLSTKGLHNNLQSTAYTYNPGGWLKTNNSSQFSMELKYENGTAPQYGHPEIRSITEWLKEEDLRTVQSNVIRSIIWKP